jgi:transcription elongation factor Elf1
MEKLAYCYNCNDDVEYDIKGEVIHINMEDVDFSYEALVAYCKKCGNEVHIDEINDLNVIRAYAAQKSRLEEMAGPEEEEDD